MPSGSNLKLCDGSCVFSTFSSEAEGQPGKTKDPWVSRRDLGSLSIEGLVLHALQKGGDPDGSGGLRHTTHAPLPSEPLTSKSWHESDSPECVVTLDWNESALHFHRALGARPMYEWKGFRLEGAALAGLADPGGRFGS